MKCIQSIVALFILLSACATQVEESQPENGRIAFDTVRGGNLEIYSMFFNGSDETNLTRRSQDDMNPDWSPDGSKIAWEAYQWGTTDIFVMDADGGNQTRLTDNPAPDYSPTWALDGS